MGHLTAREEALALLRERIWSNIAVVENCWEWCGADNGKGYGTMWVGTRKLLAHRVSWECFRSQIPDGLVIDHICRNRRCVNPEHMRVVTMRDNTMAGIGPTAKNNRKTHCIRGHELGGDNVRSPRRGDRECAACRREVLSPRRSAVRRAARGKA